MGVLSPREKEVYHLAITDMSNPEMADKLCIADGTLKFHLYNIYDKLGVKTRAGLMYKHYDPVGFKDRQISVPRGSCKLPKGS